MTDRTSNHINKLLIILSILFSFNSTSVNGQENISGVINKYAKVTYCDNVADYVVIGDLAQASQFSPGDYVLLIQMQGVGIQTVQNSYGINVQTRIGTPGAYEFLRIDKVNYVSGRVDFTRNVYLNYYDATGNVQLVQVPFYDSSVVTANLASQPWNSATGTGGIIAMLVGKKLTLNADIDVTGQGFVGAQGVSGIGECVYTNVSANNHDSYPLSWNNAGLKGEGVAIHNRDSVLLYPNHAKGQGRNFTGGGGGNGLYSGGGGGSNRGKGGDGGSEIFSLCASDPRDGGYGGMNILGSIIQDGIFPGGGGGASTQATGSTASAGGNGGGIVIIVADSIDGNSHIIRSTGVTAANAVSNAGAGGGGAGGSVAISFQGFTSPIQVFSNGGNGGTNPGGFGGGGGGGGGLIWLSSAAMPASITGATVAYGTPSPNNPAEGTGEIKYSYIPKLNGFLFNSIRSVATGNRVDSVCSNTMFGMMTGTRPVGGTPPYAFEWQRSTTSATALDFATAPGTSNQQHYTPPSLLTQTTWFRRIVTDNGGAITDISLPVRIEVHPSITNNVIGSADTLCYGQTPSVLNSAFTLQNGNGIYTYTWESSTDNAVFTSIPATAASYQPAGLIQTTWYRRTVNSGSCVSVSASVRINVLDTIKNNSVLNLPQEICQGMTFTNLAGSSTPTLSGGDNSFRFIWESSTDGSNWVTATGTINGVNYDPNETAPYFPGQEYFRRVVLSGSNDVCKNVSHSILLSEYPVITNNLVTADQTLCSGSVPAQLTGSAPLNGKGTGSYTYTWQDSSKSHTWSDISGYINVTNQNFVPPSLTDTTRYRRIVYSSACSDISKSIIINVHKPVTNNSVSLLAGGLADTTVCSGATPHRFVGTLAAGGTNITGDFIYQWSSSPDNSSWTDITASATGSGYQPTSLTSTTWFRRRAVSGQCSLESGIIKVTVLPLVANNTISGNQTVCKSDTPEPLTQASGPSLSGGGASGTYTYLWEQSKDGTAWIAAQGTNNQTDGSYQPPVMTRTMKYRRTVNSGANDCCTSTSNVLELVLDSLPAGSSINAGPDTIIYSFDYIVRMVAEPAITGGTGKWTVVDGSGSFDNDSENDTQITGLSKGLNTYLWTVTRGACKLEDQVSVTILDLVIPEGFSPNNDPGGYNNKFVVNGLDLPNQTAELTIINGAGAEVYYTSNRNGNEWSDWDGKNSKGVDLPEGTYYYLLKITSKGNGQAFKKSGFIVLKRY